MSEELKNQTNSDDERVYYHLLNGNVIYSDAKSINWEENIKSIGMISEMADNCRAMIARLMTGKPVKITDENGDEKEVPIMEHAKTECEKFFETNHIKIDYSMFDNADITEREKLIARLIDILTIHNELIMVSAILNASATTRHYYETIIQNMSNTNNNESEEHTNENQENQNGTEVHHAE